MIYDLIEVKLKHNKKKIIIITISVIAIISVIVGLVFLNKKIEIKSNRNIIQENQMAVEKGKIKHIPVVNMLPNYTEYTKENVKNLYHSEKKTCYLTFDDGPSKTVTPLLLDLLNQENIKATFFVLGSRAELNPDLIKREFNEGHYIANHGYSHIYSNIYASQEAVLDEYNKTKEVISNILQNGYDGHLFRFPGGSTGGKYKNIKRNAKNLLADNNIASVDWNALSSDAAGATTKEQLIENVKSTVGTKNTVVILMHDAGDKILTYEALPEIIAYLREQGFEFENFYNIIK